METRDFQRWTALRKVDLLFQLIRGERKLVDVCREHDLITPYSPEQNGMIERFFRTRDEAFLTIATWLEKYTERPHSALGYLTPKELAERLAA